MSTRRLFLLRLLLLGCGLIDCLALLVVVMPWDWIAQSQTALGLEPLPEAPIVNYLARSSSLLYAAHGLLLVFLSFEVQRYRPVIRFLAWIALPQGLLLVIVDVRTGMQLWWTCLEGPLLAAWGLVALGLTRGPTET